MPAPAGPPAHPVPVDDLVQPSLADAGSGGEPGLAHPGVFCTRLSKVPAARSRSACRISGSGIELLQPAARVNASTIRAPREMITMDGHARPARRLVPDELEQVMRLAGSARSTLA